ncbi:MAG: hypothetical protein ACLSFA_15415, partial [Roseburia inulinivorans]
MEKIRLAKGIQYWDRMPQGQQLRQTHNLGQILPRSSRHQEHPQAVLRQKEIHPPVIMQRAEVRLLVEVHRQTVVHPLAEERRLRIQHLPVGMVVQIRLVEQQAHHQQEQIQEAMWEVEILQEEVRIRIYLPVDHQAVPEVPAVHRTVGHLLVVEIVIVIQETLVQALPVVMAKTLDGQMIFYKR